MFIDVFLEMGWFDIIKIKVKESNNLGFSVLENCEEFFGYMCNDVLKLN